MKTFKKFYIGKGKQVEGLNIAKCTCRLEDLEQFSYEYDGGRYVTFEVAKMKQADNFGRDYTLYVSKKEESEEAEENQKKLPKRQRNPKGNWKMPVKKVKIFLPKTNKSLVFRAFLVVATIFFATGNHSKLHEWWNFSHKTPNEELHFKYNLS